MIIRKIIVAGKKRGGNHMWFEILFHTIIFTSGTLKVLFFGMPILKKRKIQPVLLAGRDAQKSWDSQPEGQHSVRGVSESGGRVVTKNE